MDNGKLEIFTCNDKNIETIGTVISDGNKSIVTINDDSVLQNADIVVTNDTRFKKVPKERITELLLKKNSEKVILEEIMSSSDLFSGLEVDIASQANQEILSEKVKKLEKTFGLNNK